MTTIDEAITNRAAIRRTCKFASKAAAEAQLPPHALIRALRTALHMTQSQLAKRAGLPQSHLARVESGKVDPRLSTLRKVLGALFCDMLTVPRMRRKIDAVLEERIKEKARENVSRAATSEKRPSDGETIRARIRSEESRLRTHPSSEIWAETLI
jgi:transcriptional regulator with XRE-family HTH domain